MNTNKQSKDNSNPSPAKKRKSKRNPYAAKIGYAVFAFALVGAIALGIGVYNMTRSLLDNSAEINKYEAYILPAVMFDPVPFNTPENADPSFVLQAAMWSALLGENRSNYPYDELGLLIVPASDLDVQASTLFGPNVTVVHRTFDDNDASYLYDEEIKAYRVPLVSKISYSPSIEKVVKKGNTITLKVGYVPPGNIWSTDIKNDSDEVTPDKYMVYEIKKDKKNGNYIQAVKDPDDSLIPIS